MNPKAKIFGKRIFLTKLKFRAYNIIYYLTLGCALIAMHKGLRRLGGHDHFF